MDSSHNKRIKAKRENDIKAFREVTGANEDNARAYLQSNTFDVDAAVGAFFASGGQSISSPTPISKVEDNPGNDMHGGFSESAQTDDATESKVEQADDITAILDSARQVSREEQERVKFRGKGHSLSAASAPTSTGRLAQSRLIDGQVSGEPSATEDDLVPLEVGFVLQAHFLENKAPVGIYHTLAR
jgi:hypothetical protein